eukprot:CAMPEP_0117744562 /NCGR_PEP_ID=MMETSP0947-20121206/6833_1 /TAXON_ID=44440 /ORGANISM="Chattonella subsalsa, Strain CCMP2191" /LENGTH=1052 /DNA_ID=CAMNT_0005561535 /DNA_START=129 /DNA_END=3285 /DNA_ORIENTATION=+
MQPSKFAAEYYNNSAVDRKRSPTPKISRTPASLRWKSGFHNLGNRIFEWQLTGIAPSKLHSLPSGFQGRLDEAYEGIPQLVANLRSAIQQGNPAAMAGAISAAFTKLVDNPAINLPNQDPHSQGGGLRGGGGALRESFVLFGGVDQICACFRPPFATRDARQMDAQLVQARRAETWNEALVLLRELCFSHPSLAESPCGDPDLVVFWFTLMSHPTTFDNAVGLIEEVLAVNPTTFALNKIHDLYGLVRGFSCRQLAHFCRVLALLVFEPEDRQLVETTRVLRSLELLQLRRDRVARANTIIDCNQALILGMPELVSRLVKLLRFMNYSPPLSRLSTHHMTAHFPSTLDVLLMLRGHNDHDDWDHLEALDQIVRRSRLKESEASEGGGAAGTSDQQQQAGGNPPRGALEAFLDLLNPLTEGGATDPRTGIMDISRLMEAIHSAQASRLIPPAVLNLNPPPPLPPLLPHKGVVGTTAGGFPVGGPTTMMRPCRLLPVLTGRPATHTGPLSDPRQATTIRGAPQEAHSELQFNAVLLSPHQVEVLFVLCTLLGGRRKVDVQEKLAELGLIPALEEMFPRLSWGAPPQTGPNPLERIHGPGCECNPESALRVQYLRLIHNFCDRDCDNNPHKNLMLSADEQQALAVGKSPLESVSKGLLTKIITELMREPADSLYKFWLASCVEAYLRGSSVKDQMFVAESGLLRHLLQEIFSEGLRCTGSLQTAFDLLGELTKGNKKILESLESMLSDDEVEKLLMVVTDNLVDSNVFVRSLVLTIDHTSRCFEKNSLKNWRGHPNPSYLMHSWCEVPSIPRDVAPFCSAGVSIPPHTPYSNKSGRLAKEAPDSGSSQSSSPSRLIFNMHIDENAHTSNLMVGHDEPHSIWQRWPVPSSIQRIERSLTLKLPSLLRDLMSVVDLEGINHENICCLNTVIVILIFAHRRNQLAEVLESVRQSKPQVAKSNDLLLTPKKELPKPIEDTQHFHSHSHHHHSRSKNHLEDDNGSKKRSEWSASADKLSQTPLVLEGVLHPPRARPLVSGVLEPRALLRMAAGGEVAVHG